MDLYWKLSHARNTHHSILTVHVLSTAVVISGCQHVGELLMVTMDVVNMDRCDCKTAASTHNHSVLQINGAGLAARHRSNIKYQMIIFCYYLLYPIRGIKARSGCGWGVGEQFCTAGAHQKYPLRTLPGHMVRPPLRQRVGLLPLSIKGEAGWPRSTIRTAACSVGWLWMISPTWVWEAGQHTAPVTRKPYLGRGAGVISIILTSRYQEC